MEYSYFDNGTMKKVYDFEDAMESIRIRNLNNENIIKQLKEENKRLKELNETEEIKKLQEQIEQLKEEKNYGFTISEDEHKKINKWIKKHDKECSCGYGTAGDKYSYTFLPTGLGTIGTIKCSCGAKYCFQEIK